MQKSHTSSQLLPESVCVLRFLLLLYLLSDLKRLNNKPELMLSAAPSGWAVSTAPLASLGTQTHHMLQSRHTRTRTHKNIKASGHPHDQQCRQTRPKDFIWLFTSRVRGFQSRSSADSISRLIGRILIGSSNCRTMALRAIQLNRIGRQDRSG